MINTSPNNTTQQKKSHKIKPNNLTHPRKCSKRFSLIPDEIKKRKDLSTLAKYVYGDLIKFVGKNNNAFPKRQTISESCGISIKLVDKAVKELKEAGLIWVERRGLRKSNVYYLIEQEWQREALPPPPIVEEESGVGVTPEMPNGVTPIGIDHGNIIHIAEESPKPVSRNFRQTGQHDIAKKMVDLWVQIVEEGCVAIEMSNKLTAYLKQALKDRFSGCLEKWKAYCKKIASSKYLMGEKEIKGVWGQKWRASLEWCLKFANIDKILSGNIYGFGDRVKKPTVAEYRQALEVAIEEIEKSTELETVKKVKISLVKEMGIAPYQSWIKNAVFDVKEGGIIDIQLKYGLYVNRLEMAYGSRILRAVKGVFNKVSLCGQEIVDWELERKGLPT